jgi:hypothetical protein
MSGQSNVEQPDALSFDSTQTMRAVTVRELRDPNQQKWFVVQLAVSDRPVNLETLPRFEVFAIHRLYAVQGRLGANACYALRLGFFGEQQSAQAICADLRAFYRSAAVVQISAAEQARFERAPTLTVPEQKPAARVAEVIEISSVRNSVTTASTVAPQLTARKAATVTQGRGKFKSLSQELLEEARQIELAKTARHTTKQQNASWLSRWLGRSND